MRRSPLPLVAGFVAACLVLPAAAQQGEVQRLVALSYARVVAALGYAPLNPASNLSDVAAPATARSNLGLGTAATANTGTSGATVPLLNAGNTFGPSQTFSNGINVPASSGVALGLGPNSAIRDGSANSTMYLDYSTGGGTGALQIRGGSSFTSRVLVDANGNVFLNQGGGYVSTGPTAPAAASSGELVLSKIAASGTGPGAGTLKLAVVPGTTSGTCKIIAYAGTSATPSTLLDNIGSGC